MQPPVLIEFSLVLIVVSEGLNTKDSKWHINVKRRYQEQSGSNVTIRCNFTYPKVYRTNDVEVYWKTKGTSICSRVDKDKQAFVFHTNTTCVHDDFKGRTRLIGNPANGDCTLEILNVTRNEPEIYVRVFAKDNYSFKNDTVSISVNGNAAVTSGPDTNYFTGLSLPTTKANENQKEKIMYLAIFIPVAVMLLVLAGVLIIMKHKRSKSFTREESGYYANFSRASADTPQTMPPDMKVEQTLTKPKAVDEPVYINLEAPTTEMHQGSDHPDHIYGNVDYST